MTRPVALNEVRWTGRDEAVVDWWYRDEDSPDVDAPVHYTPVLCTIVDHDVPGNGEPILDVTFDSACGTEEPPDHVLAAIAKLVTSEAIDHWRDYAESART